MRTERQKELHRAAGRRHYAKNREAIKVKTAARYRALRDEIWAAKAMPCADCGLEYPPYVMDFDHLPEHEKAGEIGDFLAAGNRQAIIDEIAKCEVVCSNCHRERTHQRHTEGNLF